MAGIITSQDIIDGLKLTVVKYTIKNDWSGELAQDVLFDVSAYSTQSDENKIIEIHYELNNFSAELFWDATVPIPIMSLAKDNPYQGRYWDIGGFVNNGAAGRTGDILISTTDLLKGDGNGFIVLYLIQKNVTRFREV